MRIHFSLIMRLNWNGLFAQLFDAVQYDAADESRSFEMPLKQYSPFAYYC